jgi:hypothetical protein
MYECSKAEGDNVEVGDKNAEGRLHLQSPSTTFGRNRYVPPPSISNVAMPTVR